MRIWALAIILATPVLSTFGAAEQNTASPVVAYAYVGTDSNQGTPGQIFAFSVQENGSAQAVSGSPFSAASGWLAITTHYLFATDGTNIITYARSNSGSLSPVSSINGTAHNDNPNEGEVVGLTLDRSGSTLYAGEADFQGADNDAFAFFEKNNSTGHLSFLGNSPINVNYGGPLTFSHDNEFAYGFGCYFATWDLFGFSRATSGKLTSFDPGTTYPPEQTGDDLCPSAVASSAKGYLAVAYLDIQSAQNRLILYRVTSSGGLTTLPGSEAATSFKGVNGSAGVNALWFDPTGTYLAAAGMNGLQVFLLHSNGTLSAVGSAVLTGATVLNVA